MTRWLGLASSYLTSVLHLTLLAPNIVETILDGRSGPVVTLARLLDPFPLAWNEQQDAVETARREKATSPSFPRAIHSVSTTGGLGRVAQCSLPFTFIL